MAAPKVAIPPAPSLCKKAKRLPASTLPIHAAAMDPVLIPPGPKPIAARRAGQAQMATAVTPTTPTNEQTSTKSMIIMVTLSDS